MANYPIGSGMIFISHAHAKGLFKYAMQQLRLGHGAYGTRVAQAAKTTFAHRTRLHDALADNCAMPTDPLWVLKELSRLRRASIARYPTNLPYDPARPWERAPSGRLVWSARSRYGFLCAAWTKEDAERIRDTCDADITSAKKGQK